jgi:hypothetical protein
MTIWFQGGVKKNRIRDWDGSKAEKRNIGKQKLLQEDYSFGPKI